MTNVIHATPDVCAVRVDPQVILFRMFPSGHEIRVDLLDRVNSRIPVLDRNRDYSLEEICGRELWRALPKGERIRGGITIAFLVKTGQLPLKFACCPHRSNKTYKIQ